MSHVSADHRPTGEQRSNAEWIAGLRSNERAGLDVQADLRRYIRRGLGRVFGTRDDLDDAALEDLTQEALVRITTKLQDFRGDSRLTTWAMSIAIRVAYTTLRTRRWGDRSLEDLGLAPGAAWASGTARDPTGRADLLDALRAAIDELTPRQRAAVLGELAGMPTLALAEQLGTNANALYKLHHDARLRLRAALERRGFSKEDVRSVLQDASDT